MNTMNRFFRTPDHSESARMRIFLGERSVSEINFSDKKNQNQGFSLIELIVVIAIMAVLILVLAPSLLSYNERSRAEKDNSSMDEVVNAIQLALADQKVYDEVLRFSTVDNISCYVDTNSEANYAKVVTKSNPDGVDQYTFTSNARLLDETPYFAAGNMRGVTITFAPNKDSNESTYDLKQGVVNQYIQVSDNQRVGAMPELYNRLRSSVGDTIAGNSQTYRNSEYTIFIRLGTIGGNDEAAQDAVSVYGQWSGTNLPQQVSYQLVTDRITGDDGKQIVEIDDTKWNEDNGTKITLKPGDLNGGGSFTPGTETGNKDGYTAEDFSEDEKGIYAYLVNGNTLVLRNSPRQDMSNVTKDYGILDASHNRKWANEKRKIEYIDIETPILPISCENWFSGMVQLVEIKNVKNLCVDECTKMNAMFNECKKLTELDLSNFNTTKVYTTQMMFSGCRELTTIDVSNFNTSNVTNMGWMFQSCGKLTSIDLGSFDTSNVIIMYGMFTCCTSLTSLDVSNFNTSNVTSMNAMFNECKKLTEIDVSNWNTSNVTEMFTMFNSCSSLKELDVSGFDTSKVSNMDRMFTNCSNLKELDVSNFNTAKVTNMNSMFGGCSKLTELDVSNWNTSNVTDMGGMFWNCSKLTSLDVSNWNTENVTIMSKMFRGCSKLTELDVSNFDTDNVTTMNGMFQDCHNLTELDVSNFNTENVTDMYWMFTYCYNLTTEITIRGNTTSYSNMFNGAANKAGASITVNYTAETSDLVDAMIATKNPNGNVVKGQLVE